MTAPHVKYDERPSGRSTDDVHLHDRARRLRGMPTIELLSLIAAVLLWITLLNTIAPET